MKRVTPITGTSIKRGLSKEANRVWNTPEKKAKKAFNAFLQEETKKLNQNSIQ